MLRRTFLKITGLSSLLPYLASQAKAQPQQRHFNPNQIPTGFAKFDIDLDGGLRTGHLVIITGDPSLNHQLLERITQENNLQKIALGNSAPRLEFMGDLADHHKNRRESFKITSRIVLEKIRDIQNTNIVCIATIPSHDTITLSSEKVIKIPCFWANYSASVVFKTFKKEGKSYAVITKNRYGNLNSTVEL